MMARMGLDTRDGAIKMLHSMLGKNVSITPLAHRQQISLVYCFDATRFYYWYIPLLEVRVDSRTMATTCTHFAL